jgi:hypothetical protein
MQRFAGLEGTPPGKGDWGIHRPPATSSASMHLILVNQVDG